MIVLIDSLAVVFLIFSWWIALASYPRLPASIPVHFNLSGEPDSWGGRWMIFLLPVVSTAVFALEYLILQKVITDGKMPAKMLLPLHLLLLELTALFAYLTWQMTVVALGRAKGLSLWFLPVVLLVVFGTVGWMLVAGKAR